MDEWIIGEDIDKVADRWREGEKLIWCEEYYSYGNLDDVIGGA